MFHEIVFAEGIPDVNLPYLGGGVYLPSSMVWPTDSSGGAMMHLASFPAAFLNRFMPSLGLENALMISIFCPYSLDDDEYIDRAMNGESRVLAYHPCATSVCGNGEHIDQQKIITIVENPNPDSEENGIAKIGGIPAWIQDEEAYENMEYVLQISNSRLNKAVPTHKSILVGGCGYLMLKRNIRSEDSEAGKFPIQTS
jgi:hypothetical protein